MKPAGPGERLSAVPASRRATLTLAFCGLAVFAQLPEPYRRWLEQDVSYIITAEERERFLRLPNDRQREAFIEDFWRRRDPTPGTAENEFKEEHYRRIAYSNARFAETETSGWRTDRGRLYVVEGPPDEIQSYPSKQFERWI